MVTAGNRTEPTGLRSFRELPSISILYCNFCRQASPSLICILDFCRARKKEKWRREEGKKGGYPHSKNTLRSFCPRQGLNAKWVGRAIHPSFINGKL